MATATNIANHLLPLHRRCYIVINGCVPYIKHADAVSRWLVISRACVFTMTFTSGLFGVLPSRWKGGGSGRSGT